MNSRERVICALNHKEPDMFPIDFGGHRSSGIMAIAYAKLRKYLGLPEKPIKVYDLIQQLALIDEDVLELFHVDVRDLGRAFCDDHKAWQEWVLPDGTPCLIPSYADVRKKDNNWYLYNAKGEPSAIQKEGMLYFEQILWPWKGEIPEDVSALEEATTRHMWSCPTPPLLSELTPEKWTKTVRDYYNGTDKAVTFIFGGSFFEVSCYVYGIENFMMSMALNPEGVHRHLDGLLTLYMQGLETWFNPIAEYCDIILVGDDLGMQTGPQFSLDMYQEFFRPRQKALWKRIKEIRSVIKINLHSCGDIKVFLPDLINNGLDTVNPVQTSAGAMIPEDLKKEFAPRLALWGGGCDTQHILSNGTPEDVTNNVRREVEILSPGGSFIFQQVHNIMADVPPENIYAMFKEANRLRGVEI